MNTKTHCLNISIYAAALVVTLSTLWTGTAVARDLECETHLVPPATSERKYETSSEIEIEGNEAVMSLFTTTDGTIGPVVTGHVEFLNPEFVLPKELLPTFTDYAKREGIDVLDVPWDVLSAKEQVSLILHHAKVSKQNVLNEKLVQGIKFRERVKLRFPAPVRFLGRDLKAGEYEFPAAEIFGKTAIEFSGVRGARDHFGVELHMRSDLPAEEVFESTRALERALGFRPTNMHLHVVTKAPAAETVPLFQFMHFMSLVQLYFEFKAIERGVEGVEISSIDQRSMWPITDRQLETVFSMLDGSMKIKQIKAGLVAFAGRGFYDDPDLVGLELRYLSPGLNQQSLSKAIKHIRSVLQSHSFPLPPALADRLGAGIFPEDKAISMFPGHGRSALRNRMFSRFGGSGMALATAADENAYMKYLTTDWTRVPILNDLDQNTISRVQAEAAAMIGHAYKNGPPDLRRQRSNEALRYFIQKSGLARRVFRYFEEGVPLLEP